MPLKFYYDLMSQPSRAIYIFLKINEIPFESKPIALRNMEHLSDEFAQINPFKKVPVIDDDGFILTESVAIVAYLADKYQLDRWYPKDFKERARVDEYANWQHLNIRATGSMVFRTKIITPRLTNKPVNEEQLKKWRESWYESLNQLETVFLARSTYLAADHLTFADLLGICEVMQPLITGEEFNAEKYPRVYQWIERVKKDTEPYFSEAHRIAMRMREMLLKDKISKL